MMGGSGMPEDKWYISRTITVANILAILGMMVALFAFGNDFDDRVDLLGYRADKTDEAIQKEHEYVKEAFDHIRSDLDYIRKRLDSKD